MIISVFFHTMQKKKSKDRRETWRSLLFVLICFARNPYISPWIFKTNSTLTSARLAILATSNSVFLRRFFTKTNFPSSLVISFMVSTIPMQLGLRLKMKSAYQTLISASGNAFSKAFLRRISFFLRIVYKEIIAIKTDIYLSTTFRISGHNWCNIEEISQLSTPHVKASV